MGACTCMDDKMHESREGVIECDKSRSAVVLVVMGGWVGGSSPCLPACTANHTRPPCKTVVSVPWALLLS